MRPTLIFLSILLVATVTFAAAPPPGPPAPACPTMYVWGPIEAVTATYGPAMGDAPASVIFRVEYTITTPDWGNTGVDLRRAPWTGPRSGGWYLICRTQLSCGCCVYSSEARQHVYGVYNRDDVLDILSVLNDNSTPNINYYEEWCGELQWRNSGYVEYPDPGPFPD